MSTTTDKVLRTTTKAVLIDISGTLHIGRDAIPGAIDACRKLFQHQQQHNNNLQVLFLTNTSKVSSVTLLQQLRNMGFDKSTIPQNSEDDDDTIIMTSVGATRRYLLQHNLRPLCLVEDEILDTDFEGVDTTEADPNCVLVGLAPSKFNYDKLNEAFRLLLRLKEESSAQHDKDSDDSKPPLLVVIHRATYYRDADHMLSLGPGGFVSLLEQTCEVSAHVVGKPRRNFYRAALSSLGVDDVDPSQAVMVGDDVVGDIKGALDAGLGGAILVKTGKYVYGDELGRKTGGVVPTLTVDSIVEAVEYICSTLE